MIKGKPVAWLLEEDNPSARYMALTDLLERQAGDPLVVAAQTSIPGWGPARAILDAQWPEGYWMQPGIGYSPRHKATVWQVIFLAALGMPRTEALHRACTYVLENSRLPDGMFSAYKTSKGATACLNGNLLRAMLQLGFDDPRLEESLEALAKGVLHQGFRCRFNIPVAGAGMPARMQAGLPCAWGAVKTLGALAEVPKEGRSQAMQAAIGEGIILLSQGDPTKGDYPAATEPSPRWSGFGFPLDCSADLLEVLEVLGRLRVDQIPWLASAVEVILSKSSQAGRWPLEHTPKNTWARFGKIGQPNKWVTLRALRVLKDWGEFRPEQ
jgi:hypothetical protein